MSRIRCILSLCRRKSSCKSTEQILNPFTLSYIDADLNQAYKKDQKNLEKQLYYVCAGMLAFMNAYWSYGNMKVNNNLKLGLIRLATSILLVIGLLVNYFDRKRGQWFKRQLILIAVIIYSITTSEMFLPFTKNLPFYKDRYFTTIGLFSGMNILLGMMYYQSFQYQIILNICYLYMFARYENITGLFGTQIKVFGYISCFALMICSYLFIKNYKNYYYQIYIKNRELYGWRLLLEKTLPFPIVVASYKSVFQNSSSSPPHQSLQCPQQNMKKAQSNSEIEVQLINKKCVDEFKLNKAPSHNESYQNQVNEQIQNQQILEIEDAIKVQLDKMTTLMKKIRAEIPKDGFDESSFKQSSSNRYDQLLRQSVSGAGVNNFPQKSMNELASNIKQQSQHPTNPTQHVSFVPSKGSPNLNFLINQGNSQIRSIPIIPQNNIAAQSSQQSHKGSSGDSSNSGSRETFLLDYLVQLKDKVRASFNLKTPRHSDGNPLPIKLDDPDRCVKEGKEFVFLNCKIEEQKQSKKLYDIVATECLWEGKKSMMFIFMDISQKVRNKKLKEINSYKDHLLATVTHDLKTPLNGILQIIENNIFEDKIDIIRANNLVIQKNGNQLLSLIHDILDYSQVQKGVLRLIPEQFDLRECIHDVFNIFQFQAQSKKIILHLNEFRIPGSQGPLSPNPFLILNDQRRLKQVLINFVGNSIKFTQKGHILIQIFEHDQDFIKITVKDTGCGIPKSLQHNLFKLYGTYDHNKGSNRHGVGLGLTICRQLIKLLGNDAIVLESEEKLGTSITFFVRRVLQDLVNDKTQKNQMRQLKSSLSIQEESVNESQGTSNKRGSKFKEDGALRRKSNLIDNRKSSKERFQKEKKLTEVKEEIQIIRENYRNNHSSLRFITTIQDQQNDESNKNENNNAQESDSINEINLREKIAIDLNVAHNFQNKNKFKNLDLFLSSQISDGGQNLYQSRNAQEISRSQRLHMTRLEHYQQELVEFFKRIQLKYELQSINILIVDDTEFNVFGLTKVLELIQKREKSLKMNILPANSGQQAINILIDKYNVGYLFNFVFMDLNMPGMDGVECIVRIRKLIRESLKIYEQGFFKIITNTAFDEEVDKQRCLQFGADHHIVKPVTIESIHSCFLEIVF